MARTMPRRRSSVIPGSPQDLTIKGFCIRHGMSKPSFYRLPESVRNKLITAYGPKTLRILPKDEAKFDRDHARPGATEQRLIARMRETRGADAEGGSSGSGESASCFSQAAGTAVVTPGEAALWCKLAEIVSTMSLRLQETRPG